MDQNVEIKEEPVWLREMGAIKSEVHCDVGEAELGGLAQLSQSSYSALINMGNATSVKREDLGFGFVDVSQGPGHVVPLECVKPPDEDPLALPLRPAPHIKRDLLDCNKHEILDNVKEKPSDPERTLMDVGQLSPTTGMLHSSANSRVTTWPSIGLLCNNEDIKPLRNIADKDEQSRTSDFGVKLVRNINKNILEGDTLPFSVFGGVSCANETLDSSEQTGLQDVDLCTSDRKQEDVASIASSQHTAQVDRHSHEKPWACDQCSKRFITCYQLKIHKRIHSGENPFACGVCDQRFSHRSNLSMHKMIHSGLKVDVCDLCSKRFSNCFNLEMHKIHSGIKPYICKVCAERFTQCSDLATHWMIHNDKKHFACDFCGISFTYSATLSRHMMFHHNAVKPYACDLCDEKFTYSSTLTRHMKVHILEKRADRQTRE